MVPAHSTLEGSAVCSVLLHQCQSVVHSLPHKRHSSLTACLLYIHMFLCMQTRVVQKLQQLPMRSFATRLRG
jgi:hypothetical protein